jgi:hypothetical protein
LCVCVYTCNNSLLLYIDMWVYQAITSSIAWPTISLIPAILWQLYICVLPVSGLWNVCYHKSYPSQCSWSWESSRPQAASYHQTEEVVTRCGGAVKVRNMYLDTKYMNLLLIPSYFNKLIMWYRIKKFCDYWSLQIHHRVHCLLLWASSVQFMHPYAIHNTSVLTVQVIHKVPANSEYISVQICWGFSPVKC